MENRLKILLLEDSSEDAEIIKRVIVKSGLHCTFHLATGKDSFLEAMTAFTPEIILSDNSLPQFNSEEALKITRKINPDIPFILVTGTVSEEYAVKITKSGADDYVLKDRLTRLPAAIDSAMQYRQAELQKKQAIQNLVKSEEQYRTLVDRITDAFISMDKDWHFTYLNKQAGKLFQRDITELIGQNVWDVFPSIMGSATYRATYKAMKDQHYACNQDYNAELDLWHENHIYPSADGISLFIRDISVAKKAQEEIKKANDRFEMVVSATNDVVWDWDLTTGSLWWNQQYYSHFGYDRNTAVADISSRENGIHPLDRQRVTDGIAACMASHLPVWKDEYRFLKADGSICFVLDCAYVLYDAANKPYRMAGAMLDITQRKLDEEQLKDAFSEKKTLAERLDAIINTLPANIALLDSAGIIIDVNDAWKKFSVENGYAGNNFGIGESYINISNGTFSDDQTDAVKVSAGIKAVLDNEMNEFVFEYACHTPTEKMWFRMLVNPLHEKIYAGAVVMHIDISELRKLEQERMESRVEEQKKITRAILHAQEKERNAIGAELHDNVNQILAGTKLLLSTAEKYPKKRVEIIHNSIINLHDAIEENRKIAHNLVAPDFEEIHIAEELSHLAEKMLKKAGIEVYLETADLDEDLLEVEHKLAFYRIAQEQCTNIMKYAGADLVNISLSTAQGVFRMIIADNGKGMEIGKPAKGIGFRNIRSRLSLFNGHAHINSAPGKGFVLSINMPLQK
ncbi:MAG: PAS domain S-box protein [Chitinophagaceae bacterium]